MKTLKQAKIKSETEVAVDSYLESIGVKFQVFAAGTDLIRDGWTCDGWRIEFANAPNLAKPLNMVNNGIKTIEQEEYERLAPHYKHARETFDYYTGIGLRVLPGNGKPFSWNNVQNARELKRWRTENAKPFAPFAASVLYSLLMDSSANDESFSNWCDNFGYDSDSLKALNTYNACCENTKKLLKVFKSEQIAHLNELLQDY